MGVKPESAVARTVAIRYIRSVPDKALRHASYLHRPGHEHTYRTPLLNKRPGADALLIHVA